MPITIHPPTTRPPLPADLQHTLASESQSYDTDKLPDYMSGTEINIPQNSLLVTPGDAITRNTTEWMRGHGTHVPDDTTRMTASVAGTVTKTNKLLSVTPLRARYTPEVGDLVVGRIVEVGSRRWRVDVGAALLAALPLAAINLPGGILRRRTAVDELNMRNFFVEGDLLVAEVQQLYNDGNVALHTRSLRYGKLRNGYFLSVTGAGGSKGGSSTTPSNTRSGGKDSEKGTGVVRSRRQIFTIAAAHSAGEIDIVLGVNGYIWVAKHVEPPQTDVSITRMEESVSSSMYSSQNDEISPGLRREIARVAACITALAEEGLRVDEEMVARAYEASLEMEREEGMHGEGQYLGGERSRRVVALALEGG